MGGHVGEESSGVKGTAQPDCFAALATTILKSLRGAKRRVSPA
jgi:hypothetical protein